MVQDILDEFKAEDITILDVTGMTPMCDYFVLANIISPPQASAIIDKLDQEAKKLKLPRGVEGEPTSRWILLDLGDIIIHLFGREERVFYNLEELWQKKQ